MQSPMNYMFIGEHINITQRTGLMKIVLHIGSGRTGTQSLQQFLKGNLAELNRRGVYYPILNGKNHHNPLALPLSRKHTARYFVNMYGSDYDENLEYYAKYMTELKRMIEVRNPETVILSSEFLARDFEYEDGCRLFEDLQSISNDIDIVLYLRNPADYYLSAAMQTLKASKSLKKPSHLATKSIVSNYKKLQHSNFFIREYKRDLLVGNDICRDFLCQVDSELADLVKYFTKTKNESLSAEIMSIIQMYRENAWPESDNKFNKETDYLIGHLSKYSIKHNLYRKPRLRESVSKQLNVASPDLHWLNSENGFRFSNVDYEATQSFGELDQTQHVSDVCEVDNLIRDKIAVAAMTSFYHLARPYEEVEMKKINALAITSKEVHRLKTIVEKLRKPEMEVWSTKGANKLSKENKIIVRQSFPVHEIKNTIDWDADPLSNKTWRLYFTSLSWIVAFTWGEEIDKNTRVKITSIVESFCDYCILNEKNEKNVLWDDHSVAYRGSYLAYLYSFILAEEIDDQYRGKLRYVVELHINRLEGYLKSDKWLLSNHTLFHAEGLADLATVFMTNPNRRKATISFARDELDKLIARTITAAEGTVKEHALFYHVFLMGRIKESSDYFEMLDTPLKNITSETYKRMLEFVHLVTPVEGVLPGVGDSKHNKRFDQKYLKSFSTDKYISEVTKYIQTNSEKGEKPAFLNRFETDGYFIFRSFQQKNELYGLLLHKEFVGPHGHWDGGSFITYFDKKPFFVDCGGPFKYGDPMRFFYFQTQLAHNTLLFDSQTSEYYTKIMDVKGSGSTGFVSLGAQMKDGCYWSRFFIQNEDEYQIVLDWPCTADNTELEVRFHLDPEVQVKEDDSLVELINDDVKMFFTQSHVEILKVDLDKYKKNFPSFGFNKAKDGKQPNSKQLAKMEKEYNSKSLVTLDDGEFTESKSLKFNYNEGCIYANLIATNNS
jgi:hypothetical protein